MSVIGTKRTQTGPKLMSVVHPASDIQNSMSALPPGPDIKIGLLNFRL
jgi:hypothetical protein